MDLHHFQRIVAERRARLVAKQATLDKMLALGDHAQRLAGGGADATVDCRIDGVTFAISADAFEWAMRREYERLRNSLGEDAALGLPAELSIDPAPRALPAAAES